MQRKSKGDKAVKMGKYIKKQVKALDKSIQDLDVRQKTPKAAYAKTPRIESTRPALEVVQ